ncbi:hypothetical protein F2Q70_00038918 [Brassica cretica]|uniref:Uncharacterized protein n=1 Tax=Brassica cretica TaxID=69181 RepID=A0A8S9KA49_BRACR|nr:hypothetical protein F2Q70_00038918 [Brassica cretica]KAF2618115.1 hypothetical protein F2Q68_00039605 [Brassica cretica]
MRKGRYLSSPPPGCQQATETWTIHVASRRLGLGLSGHQHVTKTWTVRSPAGDQDFFHPGRQQAAGTLAI